VAAEPEGHESVGNQEHERQREERGAQIDGAGALKPCNPCVERRQVERRQPVSRHERVDGETRIHRTVEARRMLVRGTLRVVAGHRPGGGGRRGEDAVAVESQPRGHGPGVGVAGLRADVVRSAGERRDPPQHIDEEAR
jgi:hypothetical protein